MSTKKTLNRMNGKKKFNRFSYSLVLFPNSKGGTQKNSQMNILTVIGMYIFSRENFIRIYINNM